MNHPLFTQLRRQIDEAITFHDLKNARLWVAEGLRLSREKECPGEAMYFRAQEAIIAERFKDAIDLLMQALVFNPADGAAYNDIALCMVEMGRIEGVLEIFDKGIAVEPDYATIHHNKGWFLNKIGRPSEAIACFNQALAFEPERVVTWENMANAYEEQGRIPEALDAYRKALSFLKESQTGIRAQLLSEIKRLEDKANLFP
ncbi:MAG: tetratricopeptide repeat protein [Candidatus Omnitrophica bacterium]|nr:tetratricopeptide repeat protein [Candidatus Omnitrophota bacterium]